MNYALNLAKDGRILSATYEQYAFINATIVNELPEGDISDYLYIDDEFIYKPLPKPEAPESIPTQLDIIEAQVTYTALMTDTLLMNN